MRWAGLGVWHVWRTRETHKGFWWGSQKGRVHLDDLDIDGRKILKRNLNKYNAGVDWIDLAQDRDRWRAVVNAVMNPRFS